MIELNKIYCMDCLEGMKQIEDNSVDLIITDLPYNTGMHNKENGRLNSFFNDDMPPEQYERFIINVLNQCYRVLKHNRPIFVFIDYRNVDKLKPWIEKIGFKFKQLLVWNKLIHGLNYQNYAHQYELIIFAFKGEQYFPQRKVYTNDIINVQRVNGDNSMSCHEAMKPVELIRGLIIDNSYYGNIILDPFMGSGTTAVAAKNTGRQFIGFEKEPEYIKICEKRLKQDNLNTWKF